LPFEQMLVDCHSLYCSSAQFINVIIAKYGRAVLFLTSSATLVQPLTFFPTLCVGAPRYERVKDDAEQSQAKIKYSALLPNTRVLTCIDR
jgi:hypothetical protein